MPELIDRQALLEAYDRAHKGPPGGARKLIAEAPTIEAEPVRHGRWKLGAIADNACVIPLDFGFHCTCCGKEAIRDYDDTQVLSDFCPNCGADMREVSEDAES